jgi:hypothetical protein
MAYLQIKHAAITSDTWKDLLPGRLQIGLKANTSVNPKPNGTAVTEVQTHSFENPRYTIQNVQLGPGATDLTIAQLHAMVKLAFDGTNPIYLRCQYGGDVDVVGSDGITTEIPVLLESAPVVIDPTDSKDAYRPVVNLTFTETGVTS